MVLSYIGNGFHRGSWFLLREKCIQGRSLPPEGRLCSLERSEGCNRDPRGVKTARGYTFVWAGNNFWGWIHFRSRMVLSFILAEILTASECFTLRKTFKGLQRSHKWKKAEFSKKKSQEMNLPEEMNLLEKTGKFISSGKFISWISPFLFSQKMNLPEKTGKFISSGKFISYELNFTVFWGKCISLLNKKRWNSFSERRNSFLSA